MAEHQGPPDSVDRGRAVLLLTGGLGGTAIACTLAVRGVEPFATWLYPFAWYPLLVALEGALALRDGRFFVLHRPRAVVSLLAWSVPFWMLFELLDFRIRNWYYVLVPPERPLAWLGITISFATVFPAVFLPAAMTGLARRGKEVPSDHGGAREERGSLTRGGTPKRPAAPAGLLDPTVLRIGGLLFLLLPVAWPHVFFPLVWGAFFLLAEGELMRRRPAASLLADLRRRRPGRFLALLVGGALAGLFWESLNWMARARWIYTVPGLERLKLFEMPLVGFLGFPALALSAHAVYEWLALQGVAEPVTLGRGDSRSGEPAGGTTPVGRVAVVLAPILVVGTLLGMERWSISSRSARLRDLPGLIPQQVEDLRVWGVASPFDLAAHDPESLESTVPGVSYQDARAWIDAARLATTRGIGTRNTRWLEAWGVESLGELARTDAEALVRCFRMVEPPAIRAPQVRVWQRAARSAAFLDEGAVGGEPLEPGCRAHSGAEGGG